MTALIIGVSISVGVVVNMFVDWFGHYLMHGKWGIQKLKRDHNEHHDSYPKYNPRNTNHGSDVNLPLWVAVVAVVPVTLLGYVLGRVIGYQSVMYCFASTSLLYFFVYNYIHTALHVPGNRWIERTRLFVLLDENHRVHHAQVREWGGTVNLAVVCPLPDLIMRTWYKPVRGRR